jgi:hypothetical protein
MTTLEQRLQQLVKGGLGCKTNSVNYMITDHFLDAIVHSVRNNFSDLVVASNTSHVPKGLVGSLHKFIPELIKAEAACKFTGRTALGKHFKYSCYPASELPNIVDQRNAGRKLDITTIFVQNTFGHKVPDNKVHHVDLDSVESGFNQLLEDFDKPTNIGLYFFGNDSSYGTPWEEIEDALNRSFDGTRHNLTVFLPASVVRDHNFFKRLSLTSVPKYYSKVKNKN